MAAVVTVFGTFLSHCNPTETCSLFGAAQPTVCHNDCVSQRVSWGFWDNPEVLCLAGLAMMSASTYNDALVRKRSFHLAVVKRVKFFAGRRRL